MKTVYKYNLSPEEGTLNTISIPKGAKFVRVGVQPQGFVVWALVPDTDAPKEPRALTMVPTGAGVPEEFELEFVDTIQIMKPDGSVMVSHCFEVLNPPAVPLHAVPDAEPSVPSPLN